MPKARFSSLDVAAIVSSLRSTVLGYRISNVYDINPRTYLLKLAKAGDVVVECSSSRAVQQWCGLVLLLLVLLVLLPRLLTLWYQPFGMKVHLPL